MTTLVVTTKFVLVDTRHTWLATANARTKIHQYKDVIYAACGTVGGGQIQLFQFIDALYDVSAPWPTIMKDDVDASYVLVITKDIPHRQLSKGDVLCIDIDGGSVACDEFNNVYELELPSPRNDLTVYVDGSGSQLYQTYIATERDPIVAFEMAVENDPYSDFPYQYIDRRTCTVWDGSRLSDGRPSFAKVMTVAGKNINCEGE